jgi:transcriptional regulator GlxA family with amidase domain
MGKRIGFIGYDQVTALDFVGPLEAFAAANNCAGRRAYTPLIISVDGGPFRSETGMTITANENFATAPALDTLVVPGGAGLRKPGIARPILDFLRRRAAGTRRIASVCTGLYALAEAGLMDGRRATTHWRFANLMAQRFPHMRLEPDAIHIRDGKFHTSAGVTAGIDLTLSLIADDLGEAVALAVARELVVYLKRPGSQAQFSEPLLFQSRANGGLSDLANWMLQNLDRDLSVPILSKRVKLGTRHFTRRFNAAFGISPAAYVERLRLDEARRRLISHRHTIEAVAASVGYASADAFRRAFERRFGIGPLAFKQRFSRAAESHELSD